MRDSRAIDLTDESSWPEVVRTTLDSALPDLRAYERRRKAIDRRAETHRYSRPWNAYESARASVLATIRDAIEGWDVIGWHSTRLHDDEIRDVEHNGLQLLSGSLVTSRVQQALRLGLLDQEVAATLLERQLGDESNRSGMLWFVLTKAPLRCEHRVGRLLGLWGGEGIYWRHADDPRITAVLEQLGTPCVIEVRVAIASINLRNFEERLLDRYLHRRRVHVEHGPDCEGYRRTAVPGEAIQRIYRRGERGFERLVRERDWGEALR